MRDYFFEYKYLRKNLNYFIFGMALYFLIIILTLTLIITNQGNLFLNSTCLIIQISLFVYNIGRIKIMKEKVSEEKDKANRELREDMLKEL